MIGIIDTNLVIYFVRGQAEGNWLREELKQSPLTYGISVITETELLAKPQLLDEEKLLIEECLQEFMIIPVDSTIARWAGLYRSRYQLRLGDALISATARSLDLPLWTHNTKDFQRIKGIVIQEPPVISEER